MKKSIAGEALGHCAVRERDLIAPALDALGITGRTTGEIVAPGNIRADMFRLLLNADLVVADHGSYSRLETRDVSADNRTGSNGPSRRPGSNATFPMLEEVGGRP